MFEVLKDRAFLRKMLTIAIPISLQSMISFGVQLTDTVMLGYFGEVALSASSLAGSFYMIFGCICMGLGCGAAVITAQYWGKREIDPIREMCAICFKVTIIISLVFTFLGIAFPRQIMQIYTTDEAVIESGIRYLRILSIGFLFNGLATAATQILRSVNIVKIALFATIGSFFVNVFFNYVFIFGKLGAPRLEVAGAAIGTVIARVFEFAVICGFVFLRDKTIGMRLRHMRGFSRDMMRKYIKAGVPVLVSDIIMVVGANLVTVIIGHVGAGFTAANSIASVVNNVIMNLFFGISSSSSVITGNLVGEGDYEKAYKYGKGYLIIGIILGIVGGAVLYVIKMPIINIYNVSESTRVYASQMINVLVFMLVFQLLEHTLTKGILRGGGDTRFLIVGDTVFAYVVAAPLGALAAFVWGWPCWAIFMMLKMDQVCKCILCAFRFFSRKWIKDVTVKDTDIASVGI